MGHDAGAEGRLRRAGRGLQQGPGLPAEPGGRDRQRRLREQGHPAARPGRGGARRFRPGQPAVSRSQRALARPPWPTWPWASRPWTARPPPKRFWASWRSGTSTTPPSRRERGPGRVALEPFAGRAAGTLCLGDGRGLANEVAQGQGTGRLAHGPSHRQPLGPGKGDRPRGAGLVPLVRRQPLHRRALQADRLRQRRAGQGAGHRSGRRQPVDRRAAAVPRSRARRAGSGSTSRSPAADVTPTSASSAVSCRPTSSRARPAAWRVTRYYEPAPLELDGREIPRGFGVLEGQIPDASAIRSTNFPSAAAAW